jgi:hypothetical protein
MPNVTEENYGGGATLESLRTSYAPAAIAPGSSPGIAAEWWPVTESQARYGISPSTVRRLVAEERVEAVKCGAKVLINDGSMNHYVAGLPRAVIKRDDRSAKLAGRAA